MFTYTLNQDQEARMRKLLEGGDKTPNEKVSQIFDRGLKALELGIVQRERDKALKELGRKVIMNQDEKYLVQEHFATVKTIK